MALNNFFKAGSGDVPVVTNTVNRTGGPPLDTTSFVDNVELNTGTGATYTTISNGYFRCEKGGPVLFPYDSYGSDDFGTQLNDFIADILGSGKPFAGGVDAVTIQLPAGEFTVEESIEVPSGFFIQGFGATTSGSSVDPGTRLLWRGDPNNWSGIPENDQTPWKGFCFIFRGGTMGGLSRLQIECIADTSADPAERLVTPGQGGVFVGSLNNFPPNAEETTRLLLFEHLVVRYADIGIQHGNATRMGGNLKVTSAATGTWSLKINGATYNCNVATTPVTNESVVADIIGCLNSGSPVPVDVQEVFTFNHGDNFDVIARNPSVTATVEAGSSPGAWSDENNPGTTQFMMADFCTFRNCWIMGPGSRGMLLSSGNNDLSVIESCVFSNADKSIDVRDAGAYEIRNVTCDPWPHGNELVDASDGQTIVGTPAKLKSGENFYLENIHAGDKLVLSGNTGGDNGSFWITEVAKDELSIMGSWPIGGKTGQNFRVLSTGGVGVNVATQTLRRTVIDGYNQENGQIAFKFSYLSYLQTPPITLLRYACGFPFIIAHLDDDEGVKDLLKPFKFLGGMPSNLLIKASGANVSLDSCLQPANGSLVVDGESTVQVQNSVDEGVTKTLINGAKLVEIGEPSVNANSGRRYRLLATDTGSMGSVETRALYLPLDLYFDDGTDDVRYSPACSFIGRQVEGDGEEEWPAEVGSAAQQSDIEIQTAKAGDWNLVINGRTCTYKALDYAALSQETIAKGLARVIGETVSAVLVQIKAGTGGNYIVSVFSVEPGVEVAVTPGTPPSGGAWAKASPDPTPNFDATLVIQSTGTAPSASDDNEWSDSLRIREPGDQGVIYAAGEVHQAQSDQVANITTGDFAIEFLFRTPSDAKGFIAEKRLLMTAYEGWSFLLNAAMKPQFIIDNGPNQASHTGLSALDGNRWYHYMVFCDRDADGDAYYLRAYVDGVLQSGNPVGRFSGGNLDNDGLLTFAARSDKSQKENGGIALFRVWTADDMFPGGPYNLFQWGQVAKARYDILRNNAQLQPGVKGRLFTLTGYRKGTVGLTKVSPMVDMELPRRYRVLSGFATARVAPSSSYKCTVELTDGSTVFKFDIVGSSTTGEKKTPEDTPMLATQDTDITLQDDDSDALTQDVLVIFVCQEV